MEGIRESTKKPLCKIGELSKSAGQKIIFCNMSIYTKYITYENSITQKEKPHNYTNHLTQQLHF